MGTSLAILSFLSVGQINLETRTLLTAPKEYMLSERIVSGKTIMFVSKNLGEKGPGSFSTRTYTLDGTPVHTRQEGNWNDQWNVLESTFGAKEAVQSINGEVTKTKLAAKSFRNPTILWFWKTHPRIGETVTVDILAQNTIAIFKIKYTYEGVEKMSLAGREVNVHRVREDPLSAPKGVYTHWWYDDQGMGVKRYHKTTQNEYFYELASWR